MQDKTNCSTTRPARQRCRITLCTAHDTGFTLQWVVRLSLPVPVLCQAFQLDLCFTQPLRVANIRTVPKLGPLAHISLQGKVVKAQTLKSPHLNVGAGRR